MPAMSWRWQGRLNRYVLQWFGVRLVRQLGVQGHMLGWALCVGVVPLSGYKGRPFRGPMWQIHLMRVRQ